MKHQAHKVVYAAYISHEGEPRIGSCNVVRETATRYWFDTRSEAFRYARYVPKDSACLTPDEAWGKLEGKIRKCIDRAQNELDQYRASLDFITNLTAPAAGEPAAGEEEPNAT